MEGGGGGHLAKSTKPVASAADNISLFKMRDAIYNNYRHSGNIIINIQPSPPPLSLSVYFTLGQAEMCVLVCFHDNVTHTHSSRLFPIYDIIFSRHHGN